MRRRMTNYTEIKLMPHKSRLAHLTLVLASLTLSACAVGPARTSESSSPVRPSAADATTTNDNSPAIRDDADQRFQDALSLMKARKFPQAHKAFAALSRDYPAFSGPLTDLGILYAQGKQNARALASLTRAVEANPNNAIAHNWLGTLQREQGDFIRAERSYRNAIAVKSGYAQAHLNLAILYDLALKQPGDALTEYREYQRLTQAQDLVVAAWIREIETQMNQPAPSPAITLAEAVK